jgi:menaquinone-dependent protoporphyrinogen oxidase
MKNTLIIYATTHGCTGKAAELLRDGLEGEVSVTRIDDEPDPDFTPFDTVIIGGSIRAGKIQRSITELCQNRGAELLERRLGLFLCCMFEGPRAGRQIRDAYPKALREHAAAIGLFGGELDLDKLSSMEQMAVKTVAGITESVFNLSPQAIESFAAELAAT